MSKRFLLAATALLAAVPTLASAQARPAQPAPRPAAQPARPAARPAASATSTGQREGSIELSVLPTVVRRSAGLFYGLARDGGSLGFGVTARATYNLNSKIGIGAGGLYATGADVKYQMIFASATYTMDLNRKMSPFLTLGVGGTKLGGDGRDAQSIDIHGGVGLRSFIGENLALRVEARAHTQSFDEAPSGRTNILAGSLGLSYFMGGGPPRDTDVDGVPDRRDTCANTPRGATVNATGCPTDTDRDGVYNGLDRCPDTPANTPVDANGCTRDTDRDGIADNADRCPNSPAGQPVDANGCPRDTDRDGVIDPSDRCPNSPAGQPVDANGCPRDTDSDGVLDPADRCPNTPAGTPVDANGCPRDADADGVWDNRDTCPNTAAGTQVDANGCPIARDADRDGVVDANDRCPNTEASRRVDANGCPMADLPAVGAALVLRNVTFTTGTNRLAITSRPALDQIAAAILATPGSRWEIGGHTDNRGVVATNNRLSLARAQAVMAYLVSKGVPTASVTAVGYGSRSPAQPNTTVAGRAANRRVEVKRLQ